MKSRAVQTQSTMSCDDSGEQVISASTISTPHLAAHLINVEAVKCTV